MFVTMFTDVAALSVPFRAVLYRSRSPIRSSRPKRLLFDDFGIVLAGIAYEVVFAAGAIWLAARLFQSDRLLTGSAGRLGRLLDSLQR